MFILTLWWSGEVIAVTMRTSWILAIESNRIAPPLYIRSIIGMFCSTIFMLFEYRQNHIYWSIVFSWMLIVCIVLWGILFFGSVGKDWSHLLRSIKKENFLKFGVFENRNFVGKKSCIAVEHEDTEVSLMASNSQSLSLKALRQPMKCTLHGRMYFAF